MEGESDFYFIFYSVFLKEFPTLSSDLLDRVCSVCFKINSVGNKWLCLCVVSTEH